MKRQSLDEIEEKLRTAAGLLEQQHLSAFHREAALALLRECMTALHPAKSNGARRPRAAKGSAKEFERFIRSEERRAFQRWPVSLPALCTSKRGVEDCTVVDLSEAGVALRVACTFRNGTEVVVDCTLEGEARIHVRGIVRRVKGKIVAVQYRGISRADRVKILDFISKHELATTSER